MTHLRRVACCALALFPVSTLFAQDAPLATSDLPQRFCDQYDSTP
jgi:hypothetical protein